MVDVTRRRFMQLIASTIAAPSGKDPLALLESLTPEAAAHLPYGDLLPLAELALKLNYLPDSDDDIPPHMPFETIMAGYLESAEKLWSFEHEAKGVLRNPRNEWHKFLPLTGQEVIALLDKTIPEYLEAVSTDEKLRVLIGTHPDAITAMHQINRAHDYVFTYGMNEDDPNYNEMLDVWDPESVRNPIDITGYQLDYRPKNAPEIDRQLIATDPIRLLDYCHNRIQQAQTAAALVTGRIPENIAPHLAKALTELKEAGLLTQRIPWDEAEKLEWEQQKVEESVEKAEKPTASAEHIRRVGSLVHQICAHGGGVSNRP